MLGKCALAVDQQREQTRKMRIVAGDQEIAGFTTKAITHVRRLIGGLQIRGGRELRQCVAGAPERLRGLPRAQLAAVPDSGRAYASCSGFRRTLRRLSLSPR